MGRPMAERRAEAVERHLERLPPDLRSSMLRFFHERGLVNPNSRYPYLVAALAFMREVGRSPLEASDEDFRLFLERLRASGRSERTVEIYMSYLKTFLRWARQGEDLLGWWRSGGARKRRERLRDEVLSPEEVKALVRAAKSVKHKAIIAVLYEGALRVGELCSLRMRDLEHTRYGFKIRVAGKTGERTVPLVDSAPYLRSWLLVHPRPRDPDAPLFPSTVGGGVSRMSEESVWAVVRRAARRAGLGRRVHPHTLRHTRLTHLATHMTEQELKVFAGWTQSSSMASVYVHLSGRDAERAVLRIYGIEGAEEERERVQPLKPEVCPECGYVNPEEAEFCLKCGHPLTERAREEVSEAKREVEELLKRVLSHPRVREAVLEALREALESGGE